MRKDIDDFLPLIIEWIDDFQAADKEYIDKHITDFLGETERKEWVEISLALGARCQKYIEEKGYQTLIYNGFAMKERRKPFIPCSLSSKELDKYTPPFIILAKEKMETQQAYLPANELSKKLQKQAFYWQYKDDNVYSTNLYIAQQEKEDI